MCCPPGCSAWRAWINGHLPNMSAQWAGTFFARPVVFPVKKLDVLLPAEVKYLGVFVKEGGDRLV